MIATALTAFAILAWLRPRYAVGALLFLIPFGHLVRFTVAGIPFTFPEFATYILAVLFLLRGKLETRNAKLETNSNFKIRILSIVSDFGFLRPRRIRLWRRISDFLRHSWLLLPIFWVLVAAIAAIGSPAGARAWGIWKAYMAAPVVLFWIIRYLVQDRRYTGERLQMTNDEFLISNQSPNPNDQKSKFKTSYLLPFAPYLLLPLALGALIVAAIAIAQRWWPIGVPYPWVVPGKFRATSVFGYPNAVGLYLAPLVMVFVGAVLAWRTPSPSRSPSQREGEKKAVSPPPTGRGGVGGWGVRMGFIGVALLSLFAIILARSTGALIALAVALSVWVCSAWSRRLRKARPTEIHDREKGWDARWVTRRAVGVILVWVLVSLALTAWLPYRHEQPKWGPPIIQKLTFQKWSGSVRLAQYRETWALLRDHPIRGAGLAGYQQAIRPYHEKQDVEIFLYPHNLLLAIWSELGLAGLLLFLATLYQFFKFVLVKCQVSGVRCGTAAALLALLVHGLVDVPYFKNDLAMLFWVIVAVGTISGAAGTMASHGPRTAHNLPPGAPGDR